MSQATKSGNLTPKARALTPLGEESRQKMIKPPTGRVALPQLEIGGEIHAQKTILPISPQAYVEAEKPFSSFEEDHTEALNLTARKNSSHKGRKRREKVRKNSNLKRDKSGKINFSR